MYFLTRCFSRGYTKRQFRWKIRLIKNGCVAVGGGGGRGGEWGSALVLGVNKNTLNECRFKFLRTLQSFSDMASS